IRLTAAPPGRYRRRLQTRLHACREALLPLPEEVRRERERLWGKSRLAPRQVGGTRHCLRQVRLAAASRRFCPWRRSCASLLPRPRAHYRERQNWVETCRLGTVAGESNGKGGW